MLISSSTNRKCGIIFPSHTSLRNCAASNCIYLIITWKIIPVSMLVKEIALTYADLPVLTQKIKNSKFLVVTIIKEYVNQPTTIFKDLKY